MEQSHRDIQSNSPVSKLPGDYYPENSATWFTIPDGNDTGKKMFYYDHVFGDSEPMATILFVHGNPETSYTYRKVISEMVKSKTSAYRIVAMDHIGFGLSDQASYEMVDMHHAHNLRRLIQHLNLTDVTLVIHDWGGPIGIGAMIREPDRLKNMVILNSTVFPIPLQGLTYENFPYKWLAWSNFPKIVHPGFWGIHAAFSINVQPKNPAKIVGEFIVFFLRILTHQLPEKDRDALILYKDQFKSRKNAKSSMRMVRQTPVWGHGYVYDEPGLGKQDNREFYRYIQENITRLWGPSGKHIGVKAVIGKWDPLAKSSVIEQWEDALPQLKGNVQLFRKTSHFIEEHRAPEIAEAIIDITALALI